MTPQAAQEVENQPPDTSPRVRALPSPRVFQCEKVCGARAEPAPVWRVYPRRFFPRSSAISPPEPAPVKETPPCRRSTSSPSTPRSGGCTHADTADTITRKLLVDFTASIWALPQADRLSISQTFGTEARTAADNGHVPVANFLLSLAQMLDVASAEYAHLIDEAFDGPSG